MKKISNVLNFSFSADPMPLELWCPGPVNILKIKGTIVYSLFGFFESFHKTVSFSLFVYLFGGRKIIRKRHNRG